MDGDETDAGYDIEFPKAISDVVTLPVRLPLRFDGLGVVRHGQGKCRPAEVKSTPGRVLRRCFAGTGGGPVAAGFRPISRPRPTTSEASVRARLI